MLLHLHILLDAARIRRRLPSCLSHQASNGWAVMPCTPCSRDHREREVDELGRETAGEAVGERVGQVVQAADPTHTNQPISRR
jgi:hypothetical protein